MTVRTMPPGLATAIRTESLHVDPALSPGVVPARSAVMSRAHWYCTDCGAPCWCDRDARLLPHVACGLQR